MPTYEIVLTNGPVDWLLTRRDRSPLTIWARDDAHARRKAQRYAVPPEFVKNVLPLDSDSIRKPLGTTRAKERTAKP